MGVSFDERFTFSEHIINIVGRANRSFGYVVRNCSDFRSLTTVIKLYCALVRPILKYCSVVWNPSHSMYVDMIERVQKRFLRFLFFRKYGVYPYWSIRSTDLSHEFNVPSLIFRRTLLDMVTLHKMNDE